MRELVLSVGVDPAWLVKATFEANCLLLFALSFWHSMKVHGWRRTGREFSAGFTLTALERAVIAQVWHLCVMEILFIGPVLLLYCRALGRTDAN